MRWPQTRRGRAVAILVASYVMYFLAVQLIGVILDGTPILESGTGFLPGPFGLLAAFAFTFLLGLAAPLLVFWGLWSMPLAQVWWLPLVTLLLLAAFWAVHRFVRRYKDVAYVLLLMIWSLFGMLCTVATMVI